MVAPGIGAPWYSLIALSGCADGSRAVVRGGISLQDAGVVQDVIQKARIIADVQIEPECTTSACRKRDALPRKEFVDRFGLLTE